MNNSYKLIVFSLDEQCYGFPLALISKVLNAVEITPLPVNSNSLLGVINVHGAMMPVIDIRKLFGLKAKPIRLSDRFIVTLPVARPFIIVVDAVANVIEYSLHEITSLTCLPNQVAYITGVLKNANKMIFIIDVEKLLSAEDCKAFDRVKENGSKAL